MNQFVWVCKLGSYDHSLQEFGNSKLALTHAHTHTPSLSHMKPSYWKLHLYDLYSPSPRSEEFLLKLKMVTPMKALFVRLHSNKHKPMFSVSDTWRLTGPVQSSHDITSDTLTEWLIYIKNVLRCKPKLKLNLMTKLILMLQWVVCQSYDLIGKISLFQ